MFKYSHCAVMGHAPCHHEPRLNASDENVYSVPEDAPTIATYAPGIFSAGMVCGPRYRERHPLVAHRDANGRTRFRYATPHDIIAANMSEATTVTESRMQGAT